MEFPDLFSRFAVSLGIGLLIGLERGWQQREEVPGSRTAGIRTFALAGLLGGTVGALTQVVGGAASAGGGLLLGLAFASFSGAFTLFCWTENRADGTYSATMAVAGTATFALGAYAMLGDLRMAAAAAVLMTGVLASRRLLHGAVGAITWIELRAGLILLAMTFVALPLMPDGSVDWLGGVNPRAVWLTAITLAGVSFLGYAAVKFFGTTRGVLLSAAAGGLVSSTAVMLNNAGRAADGTAPGLLAAGAALASAVGLVRVLAIASVLNVVLLPLLAPPLLAATAVLAGTALLLVWRADPSERAAEVALHNPFELKSVLSFALFLGVIVVIGRFLSERYGAAGAIAAALASGLADVDAVTVAISRLTPEPLSRPSAALAILAAVASNTLSKLVLGMSIGRGVFAFWILLSSLVAVAAAGAAWMAGYLLMG